MTNRRFAAWARMGAVAIVALLLGAAAPPARAGENPAREEDAVTTGFLNRELRAGGQVMPYVVYLPRTYRRGQQLPAILFLHGAGERGADGLKQSQVGLGRALRIFSERYPAIAVLPQCPTGQWWDAGNTALALRELLRTVERYHADRTRLYLTGLSMGGYGSWTLAAANPRLFAAVVPICGGGDPQTMPGKLKDLPIWVYHGDADEAVPVQRSREMVEALQAAGSQRVRYTELPGVGHNSWDPAYESPELARWLFEQRREAPGEPGE